MLKMVSALVALATASGANGQSSDPMRYDVIIRSGTVFDGLGNAGRVADVGIVGDRIIIVGDLSHARAPIERDARGRYVAPGFISVHDHSEPDAYARPVNLLTQGITTAITNPDGGGPLDIRAQLARPLGLNYGAYIGFNSVWSEVMGKSNKRASLDDLEKMRGLVTAGMRAGAYGLSAGLDYKPGFWATTDEVIAVARAATPWRTGFTNHERVHEGNGYSSMAGMTETVEIGGRAGLQPIITHMKLQGRDQSKVKPAFALARKAASYGVTMGTDAYPYTFGSTSLEQLTIPAWAQEGGTEAMLTRFKDPVLRDRIAAETQKQLDIRWGGPSGVYLSEMRLELTDFMAQMPGIGAGEAIMRVLELGQRRVLLRFGTEADQEAIVAHPLTAVSCDCGATTSTTGHPRNWGSFPKFLGRYVRDRRLVDWPEAVRKMTALPATMVGLSERGFLLPGMIADVTIFDPKTIIDRSTITEPTLASVGIETVFVNGALALDGGRTTNAAIGKALARSRHEPGRAMDVEFTRSLRANGNLGMGVRVAVKLRQQANAERPTGFVSVNGLQRGNFTFAPSLLQTTKGWASVTGVALWQNGERGAVTLQFEQADPMAGKRPAIVILIDGKTVMDEGLANGSIKIRQHRR